MNVQDPVPKKNLPSEASDTKYSGSQKTCDKNLSPLENQAPKSVAFELLFNQSPQHRARIPMRVQIFPHDTTDSIVTTVKNFYGLYSSSNCLTGVSFEDEEGNTLIARYENFRNNMIVYVRVITETVKSAEIYDQSSYASGQTDPQKSCYYSNIYQTLPFQPPQTTEFEQNLSKSLSRNSQERSVSPNQLNMNSIPIKKSRSRLSSKARGCGLYSSFENNSNSAYSSYSNGDGISGSTVTKAKSDHIGSTEISLDNIVEGGRRKRAKFESSELPLFAPTQMPAVLSNTSMSPARRIEHQRPIIYTQSNSQYLTSNSQALQSPQGLQNGFGQSLPYSTPGVENRRTRGDLLNRNSINNTPSCNSSGIIPTPDPTVGSCVSEEDKDVALQLMRLGELSNISQGRTSASTLDDTFSGRADAASSTGAVSECESDGEFSSKSLKFKRAVSPGLPSNMSEKANYSLGDNMAIQDSPELSCDDGEYEDRCDENFHQRVEQITTNNIPSKSILSKEKRESTTASKPRNGVFTSKVKSTKTKTQRLNHGRNKKSSNNSKLISPTLMPPSSRKTLNKSSILNLQHKIGEDQEDLSSKPRCQRCRKSKKGCDRQRPCQRCKDAGLTAEQCISEDEGNGRKGRYGRHMGVPVKKDTTTPDNISQSSLPNNGNNHCSSIKKRKR